MLISQSLQKALDNSRRGMCISLDVFGGRSYEDVVEIAQLHETNVGIRIVQFGEQRRDALSGSTTVLRHDGYKVDTFRLRASKLAVDKETSGREDEVKSGKGW